MSVKAVSHYLIEEKLGEGGMGTVYRAEDTKLKRAVALKFLRTDALGSDEHKERFLREAQAAAALDHPNICTVYEIDEDRGQTFIAMALLEGQTVRDKIRSRPLKLDEALDIAIQTARALHSAHQKGIVHRDIKSANLMVTREGQVKILDFGLAKLAERTQLTEAATLLGTPAYMSPEQAQRLTTDHRTDIWSLGVVIYEMLTGRRPFEGERTQAVLYSIINEAHEPLTALRAGVPVALDRIVSKAMAKSADERYQHAEEMLVDLRALARSLDSTTRLKPPSKLASGRAPPPPLRKVAISWSLAGLFGVLFGLALWAPWRSSTNPAAVVRFSTDLAGGETVDLTQHEVLVGFSGSSLALSPDGSKLVYVSRRQNRTHLSLRLLDRYSAQPIPDTDGALGPFFSPDGRWIGFYAGGQVKTVSLEGGSAQSLCPLNVMFFGGSWVGDDALYFSDCTTGIKRVAIGGGAPELVTEVVHTREHPEMQHQFPQMLPDGETLLFTVWNAAENASIAVHSLTDGTHKTILSRGTYGRYVPTGHLLYAWRGDLLAAPFHLETLQVTGAGIPVVEGVRMEADRGAAHYAVSDNGTLAYVPGDVAHSSVIGELVWVDHQGVVETLGFPEAEFGSPRVSPDGTAILVSVPNPMSGLREIWTYDLESGNRSRLSDSDGAAWWAVWAPDGRRVAFSSTRGEGKVAELYLKPADGSRAAERLLEGRHHQQPYSWSADGTLLAYHEGVGTETGFDIRVVTVGTDSSPAAIVRSDSRVAQPAISPDGRWLVYITDASGRWEVMLRPYPGPGRITQVSKNGGYEPLWAPDGDRIYYRNRFGNRMRVASFRVERSSPIVGEERELFRGTFISGGEPASPRGRMYDLSADGERLLMVRQGRTAPHATEYRVVINWFEELRELVPVAH